MLTVAIPCRDAGLFLRPLLESLLRQSLADFRLLLVDDASRDGSAATAREVAGDRIEVLENAQSLGIADNWNRCVSAVDTDFFCLAHQDDVYHADFLATLVAALERAPEAGIAHCRSSAIDAQGRAVASGAERYKRHFWRQLAAGDRAAHYRRLWNGNFVCCPSVVYRTRAVRETGPFRSDLRFALDWEYWFRLLRSGHGIADVDRLLVDYRRHPTAATAAATAERWRFAEELGVLDEAREKGITSGLLPAGVRASPALRNNLLHETLTDLERGDVAAARAKLQFVQQHAPALWNDAHVRIFRVLSRCGPPGRLLLGIGRELALRYGLGGAGG